MDLSDHPEMHFQKGNILERKAEFNVISNVEPVEYMGYLYLSIAIIAEVIGNSALKASQGFTKFGPSISAIIVSH